MERFEYTLAYLAASVFDYEQAVSWYKKKSPAAAAHFVLAADNRLKIIKKHPKRYKKTYKEFYEVGLLRFPYNII